MSLRNLSSLLILIAIVNMSVSSSVVRAEDPPYRVKQIEGVEKIVLLPPGMGNPRNSEGDFIELKDGRIMFIYTHFTGGGGDDDAAHLAARYSSDQGKTWSDKDELILKREGDFNVMSVSLLRLQSGDIAFFYLRKNSLGDCRPMLRISKDEGKTWSEPKLCIDTLGYYVLNNDRAVQLKSGRLVLPVALHANLQEQKKFVEQATISCYLSDDQGETWHASQEVPQGKSLTLQEPGLVELKDGRLMIFCRTAHGSQYVAYSSDAGETWSEFGPSKMISPLSPATIERIPSTGDLLLVFNNHEHIAQELRNRRTPFSTAISKDDGQTWENFKTLEDDPNGWYCYTAMQFVGDHVLLGHCAGDRREGGLNTTQITRVPVKWLYEAEGK